ncbi:hypothetical protein MHK_003715 [Candidatus Magnetomorum sp. HK-1]|nr:hypothetical protein MHK_003715 [Candidatus Magnetomorum sp. HK-1]
MVVKSLSRKRQKRDPFFPLVKYIAKETSDDLICFNINTPDVLDNRAIADEFKENVSFCKRQVKESVLVYHNILSMHPDDYEKLNPEILHDLALKWLEIRKVVDIDLLQDKKGRVTSVVTGGCLVWGNIHDESKPDKPKNYHVHLMFSPNRLGETKRIRLSKSQFRKALLELEAYQKEKYPELINSVVMDKMTEKNMSKTAATRRKETEKSVQIRLDKDLSKTKRVTKVQEVRDIFIDCLSKAKSKPELVTMLADNGLVWYERGKKKTVSLEDRRGSKGKRYRLDRSLGQLEIYNEKAMEWEKIKNRKKELQVTIDHQDKERSKERDEPNIFDM